MVVHREVAAVWNRRGADQNFRWSTDPTPFHKKRNKGKERDYTNMKERVLSGNAGVSAYSVGSVGLPWVEVRERHDLGCRSLPLT